MTNSNETKGLRSIIPTNSLEFIVNKEKGTVVCRKEKNLFEFCDEIAWDLVKSISFLGSNEETSLQKSFFYDYVWSITWKYLKDRYGSSIHTNDELCCYNIYIPFIGKAKLAKEDKWSKKKGKEIALKKCEKLIYKAKANVYRDIEYTLCNIHMQAKDLADKNAKYYQEN